MPELAVLATYMHIVDLIAAADALRNVIAPTVQSQYEC
jgi:hypothetical protein